MAIIEIQGLGNIRVSIDPDDLVFEDDQAIAVDIDNQTIVHCFEIIKNCIELCENNTQYTLEESLVFARLWSVGKMIGGDDQEVFKMLLKHIEKLEEIEIYKNFLVERMGLSMDEVYALNKEFDRLNKSKG